MVRVFIYCDYRKKKTWVFYYFVQILNFIIILTLFTVVRLRRLALSYLHRLHLSSLALSKLYIALSLSLSLYLARPIFEYSSVLWNPFTTPDSSHIELVQRRFCSTIRCHLFFDFHVHHVVILWPVMNKLGLLSLLADELNLS